VGFGNTLRGVIADRKPAGMITHVKAGEHHFEILGKLKPSVGVH
jgi:hypothetical protein